jgi:predicted ribosome quality control (RQC) complex YloA/Tae2 family protein
MVEVPAEGRGVEQICQEWIESKKSKPSASKVSEAVGGADQKILKLERALKKMKKDYDDKKASPLLEFSDWLVSHWGEAIPERFFKFWNKDLPEAQARQEVFESVKKLKVKIESSEEKILDQEKRISDLKKGDVVNMRPGQQRNSLLKEAGSSGQTLALSSGHSMYVGKSAKDNLAVLRRAKSWDIWFHLRDIPSTHAILTRNRGDFIFELMQKGFIPDDQLSNIEDMLKDEGKEMLRKKTYGCLTLEDYRRKLPKNFN